MALCSRYPDAQRPAVRAGRLRWTVQLQPTAMSVPYTVRIDYLPGRCPRVVVLDPPLEVPENGSLPHVYPGNELCLYYEDEFDSRADLLADTIVPWTSEWLYFYELWLTTREWHGGGIHPEANTGSARRPRTNTTQTARAPALRTGGNHEVAVQRTDLEGQGCLVAEVCRRGVQQPG